MVSVLPPKQEECVFECLNPTTALDQSTAGGQCKVMFVRARKQDLLGHCRAVSVTVNGHMGELLQGRIGQNGPVALVTLPIPRPVVRVSLVSNGGFAVHFANGARTVSGQQMAGLIRRLTGAAPLGQWVVQSLIPPGSGSGTSTATLLGVSEILGAATRNPAKLAEMLVAIEGASDPLMFPAPERILWASRLGKSLAILPILPRTHVVAGLAGTGTRTDPKDEKFADISDLIAPWASACEAKNRAEIGRLTTISAERNITLRGGASLEPLLKIAQRHGAIGVSAAHTGSARAILFSPGNGNPEAAARDMILANMRKIVQFSAGSG